MVKLNLGVIINKDIIANTNTERGIVTLIESQLNKRNHKNPRQPQVEGRRNLKSNPNAVNLEAEQRLETRTNNYIEG